MTSSPTYGRAVTSLCLLGSDPFYYINLSPPLFHILAPHPQINDVPVWTLTDFKTLMRVHGMIGETVGLGKAPGVLMPFIGMAVHGGFQGCSQPDSLPHCDCGQVRFRVVRNWGAGAERTARMEVQPKGMPLSTYLAHKRLLDEWILDEGADPIVVDGDRPDRETETSLAYDDDGGDHGGESATGRVVAWVPDGPADGDQEWSESSSGSLNNEGDEGDADSVAEAGGWRRTAASSRLIGAQ